MNTFGLVQTSNQSSAHVQRIESPLHRAKPQRRRSQTTTQGGEGSLKVPLFPVVLYGLLEDAEKHGNASIVSWRPSGVSFKVYKREEFVDKILPKYFKQTKFKSFVRQLNLWGFMCIERGQDKGSYHHQMFIRGRPGLCKDMKRQRIKGTGTSTKTSTGFDDGEEISPSTPRRTFGDAPSAQLGPLGMHPGALRSSSAPPVHILPRTYHDISSLPAVDPIGFQPEFRPSLHPNHSASVDTNGDWFDRLERMFGPTTSEMESMYSSGNVAQQLEPRPIKMPPNQQMQHPY